MEDIYDEQELKILASAAKPSNADTYRQLFGPICTKCNGLPELVVDKSRLEIVTVLDSDGNLVKRKMHPISEAKTGLCFYHNKKERGYIDN